MLECFFVVPFAPNDSQSTEYDDLISRAAVQPHSTKFADENKKGREIADMSIELRHIDHYSFNHDDIVLIDDISGVPEQQAVRDGTGHTPLLYARKAAVRA